ncbi:MAG: silent information regulator protein Sir2 [Vicinamibacterales bacterium]
MRPHLALIVCCALTLAGAPQNPAPPPAQPSTRPPENNDEALRPLTPEEIPPNLNFYAIDPLYKPGMPLGWSTTRLEEVLDRGMLALAIDERRVYLAWRLLRSDPEPVAFNVYRSTAGGPPVKVNAQLLQRSTDLVDRGAPLDRENAWWVKAVVDGREQAESARASLPARPAAHPYKTIRLREDVRSADRIAIADLNGDGSYDFVVKHPSGAVDPGRIRPSPDTYKLDGYDGRSGAFLWRIDLGWNVNLGIWFSPMIARDLDGDNMAEVVVRTAPYAATREQAIDGGKGFVMEGPEYLAVYDGQTGKEIDKVDWIERGKVTDWADTTGNRSSRHMLGVAYLDGKTPSVLAVRGTYGLMKVDAWTFRNRTLEKIWRWTNERAPFKYQGQGQHSIKTGDIDGDGFDEILNGSIAIDHDGRTLWGTGMGHGDRFYLSDIDPSRPGLEVWYTIEDPHPRHGLSLWDAREGELIFGLREPTRDNQLAGGLAGDIDASLPGMEVWGDRYFFSSTGRPIAGEVPPQNELVWWDADPLREIHSRGTISKWKGATLGRTEGSVQHVADIVGDWREEIVTFVKGELRIYSTTIPATDRRVALMQDPLYRNDVTHRSMGYPHVPMTSFYLGAR